MQTVCLILAGIAFLATIVGLVGSVLLAGLSSTGQSRINIWPILVGFGLSAALLAAGLWG